jgi:hypothetical protein
MGKKAEEWSALTDSNTNYMINVSHPASAAYNGSKWNSKDAFVKIKTIVKDLTGEEIIW